MAFCATGVCEQLFLREKGRNLDPMYYLPIRPRSKPGSLDFVKSVGVGRSSRCACGSSTVVGSAAKDGVDKARGYRPDALSHTATPDRGAIVAGRAVRRTHKQRNWDRW